MEYILQNTLLALLEYPDSTLLDVNRMLTSKAVRAAVVQKITDPIVRAFWAEEFATYTDTYTREATPAIQNKVGQFTSNPLIRNIVGQPKSSFDLRKIMDEKKIFIVNLSKGRMGETNAALLGSMLVVKIYLAAMSRADEPAVRMRELPRFYFYVDEFQSMMNEAFADILSESRKYKLALTLANQYIEQMEEKVRDAVFGNVGTLVCFRVGPFDAEVLKTVFEPTFMAQDLVGLGIGQIYLTLMIDGVGSTPFSAETLPPIEAPPVSYRDDVVRFSRAQYSCPRAEIESIIAKRQKDFALPPKAVRGGEQRARRVSPDVSIGTYAHAQPAHAVQSGVREHPFVEKGSNFGQPARMTGIVRSGGEGAAALRAAIAAAAPPSEQRSPVALRSPAEILREKLARKAHAAAEALASQKPAEEKPKRDHEMEGGETVAASSSSRHFLDNEGEVTYEELQKILKGEA